MNNQRRHRAFARLLAACTMLTLVVSVSPMQLHAEDMTLHIPEEGSEDLTPLVKAHTETSDEEGDAAESFAFASAAKEPKIKICHANNFAYDNGKKEVDESSITKDAGHGAHDDGGYDNKGDIIPPFDVDGNPFPYEKNWEEPFISIWENDCDREGSITVEKVIAGTDAVDENDFTFFVFDGDDTKKVNEGDATDFQEGTYTVTEEPKANTPTGYTATFSGDCDAQGVIDLGVAEHAVCTITNTYPPVYSQSSYYSQSTYYSQGSYNGYSQSTYYSQSAYGGGDEVATIIATKIVCTDEADLPNWGNGGPDIDATTAQNWVDSHDSCTFAPDWEFEWASADVADPHDITTGSAGAGWHAFDDDTNASGTATVELTEQDINTDSYVWVRELLKPGYIPFTYADNDDNSNDESAEIYCATDVLNYDNWERVDDIAVGNTYHCVAWNVPEDGHEYSQGSYYSQSTYYAQASYDGGYSQGSYGGEPQPGFLVVRKIVVGTTTDESNFSFDLDKIGTVVGDLSNETFESDGTNRYEYTTGVFTIIEDAASGYTTTYSNSFNNDADCEFLLVTPNATTTCTITNTATSTNGGYSQGSYGGGYSQGSYGGGEYSQGSYGGGDYSQGSYGGGEYSQGSYGGGEYSQGSYGGGYSQGSYGNGGYSQGSYGGGGYSQGSYSSGGNGRRVELTSSGGSQNGDGGGGGSPTPQVLGESTSVFPYGAPDTGEGGGSTTENRLPLLNYVPAFATRQSKK